MTRRTMGPLLGVLAAGALLLGSGSAALAQSVPQGNCGNVAGNLVQDCGFELPALGAGVPSEKFSGQIEQGFPVAPAGQQPAWTAQTQGVDGAFREGGVQINNNAANGGFAPNSGTQSLGFVGQGGFFQQIPTSQGKTYAISFAFANSPAPPAQCGIVPTETEISVTWGASPRGTDPGTTTQFFSAVTSPTINWQTVSFASPVPGTKGASYLSFFNVPQFAYNGACGLPVIDDVVVTECTPGAANNTKCQLTHPTVPGT